MFDQIAHSYDLLNSLLSLGIDRYWRKKLVAKITYASDKSLRFMDLATGTAVLSVEVAKKYKHTRIDALDISNGMLEQARRLVAKKGLEKQIFPQWADAESLPSESNVYDALFIAFGVRNFENLERGLSEMYRVLKPGACVLILEFSQPTGSPFKQLFHFYFKYILPVIGNLWSKDPRAYSYLFESVQQFPAYERFTTILQSQGFRQCDYKPLTFGICTLYFAVK